MSVESEVVGNQADVACEQRLQPAALAPVDPDGLVAPEHAVMDEHELHARRRRALEQLLRGRDAACDLRHLVRAEDLQAGHPVPGKRSTSSSSFAKRMISSR